MKSFPNINHLTASTRESLMNLVLSSALLTSTPRAPQSQCHASAAASSFPRQDVFFLRVLVSLSNAHGSI
jgi:hypothetical protein